MTPAGRVTLVKRLALEAGFERVGIAPAGPIDRAAYVRDWLTRGRAGQMDYLHRWREIRLEPGRLLEGAQSVIVVAHNYRQPAPGDPPSSGQGARGRIARYAWGRDYHRIMKKKLRRLVAAIRTELDEPFQARVCVDTAPVLERELAAAAGVGWIGKNTMVIDPELGSFFFLGEIVTTLALTPSERVADHCGSCTRCLDACPTGAFPAPYQMDASRCISYLTIEHREAIPADLQPMMGDWVYGCDVCQDVCPHNARAPVTREPAYELSDRNSLPPRPLLGELSGWTEEVYQRNLEGSAMKRATLEMLKRNGAIARRNATRGEQTNGATG